MTVVPHQSISNKPIARMILNCIYRVYEVHIRVLCCLPHGLVEAGNRSPRSRVEIFGPLIALCRGIKVTGSLVGASANKAQIRIIDTG